MSGRPVILEGTLRPDGTLELDEKVGLPAGRVQVFVQPLPALPADDPFWQRMEAIWRGQQARGQVPRGSDEVEAERRALNEVTEHAESQP